MRYIVGSDDPVGTVVENDVAGANVESADNVVLLHVPVAAMRITAAGFDGVMVGVPVGIGGGAWTGPTPVFFVVVAILIVAAVLLTALVFPMIVGSGKRGASPEGQKSQGKENCSSKKSLTNDRLSP